MGRKDFGYFQWKWKEIGLWNKEYAERNEIVTYLRKLKSTVPTPFPRFQPQKMVFSDLHGTFRN